MEVLPPVAMHYLHLGCWCTVAGGLDYFSHRRLNRGEVMGHQVLWLHTARPRDRFVFLIDPVEAREAKSFWGLLWKSIYGKPPAFAIARGRLLWRIQDSQAQHLHNKPKGKSPQAQAKHASSKVDPPGIEAIEVLHSDITAMDYAPGLTSTRLALETKIAAAHWFPTSEEAYAYYGCLDKHPSFHQPSNESSQNHQHGRPLGADMKQPSQLSFANNGSMHSDAGGEAIEAQLSSETLGFNDPSSPHPSPSLTSAAAAPLAESFDGLPPSALVLPPSSAVFQLDETLRTTESLSALCAKATPDGSPDLPPSRSRRSMAHTYPNANLNRHHLDPETLLAETAAAGMFYRFNEVQPVQTLKHFNTMVIVYAQDPHFNAVLREVLMPEPGTFPFAASVAEQRRLLSLYETGMPSWTIFFSRYGLPYRRWFRLVAVMLVNLWPLIALCVGLYDLYKHMPYLKEFLADTLTPLTGWMETHFTLRISMLVTYLVTVSYTVLQATHSFGKSVIALTNFVIAPLMPLLQLFSLLRYPLFFLWTTLSMVLGPVLVLMRMLWLLVSTVLVGPFTALYYLFRSIGFVAGPSTATTAVQQASYFMLWWRSWLDFWDKVARPIKNVAKACYDGVVHLGVSIVRREASIRRWYTAKLRIISSAVELYIDCVHHNWLLFAALPSWKALWVSFVILALGIALPFVASMHVAVSVDTGTTNISAVAQTINGST